MSVKQPAQCPILIAMTICFFWNSAGVPECCGHSDNCDCRDNTQVCPHSPSLSPRSSPTPKTPPRHRRQHIQSSSGPHGPVNPVIRTAKRTIYTAGRPPWYDSHGQLKEPVVIGQYMVI